MSRRSRKNGDSKNISTLSIGVMVSLIVAALILSYFLFSGVFKEQAQTKVNNTQKIATSNNSMLNMITNTENSQVVSSSIGKSVNEMENTESSNIENTTKMAVNTSKVEEKVVENKESENKQVNEQENTQTNIYVEEEATADPTFAKPVEGEVVKDYSKDNLIYSNTLEEWTTHLGIDFRSEKTDVVKAVADGKIKSIKNDPRYGLTVVIEHTNGFETIYSSLLTAEFITVGEEVKQGQTIATVGNTATFEIADETHLHFEMKKDGENVDPNIYLK